MRLYWLHPPAKARFEGGRLEVPGSPPLPVPGHVRIATRRGHAEVTARLPMEEYVAAVLGGESSVFTTAEALKAMAVAVRTYAVYHAGRHRAEGFDFCDTTHCQDLRLAALTQRMREAADATEAELLWYQGSPAATFYHRHCGGTTEAARQVWPDLRAPYLRQQRDTFCGRDEWQTRLKDPLAIIRRTPSGRAAEVRFGGRLITASKLEALLGPDALRSRRFEVVNGVTVQGYGSGHGVGLCQIGAARRGEQGHSYRDILAFYYPGAALGVTAQGLVWTRAAGERVELSSTRPAQDQSVIGLAEKLLAEAERRAGFTLAARPRLKVYPAVAVFRDSTGEPGWVAASTVGRTIRLQPLGLLRSAGKLESTLLHELLHIIIESRAHPGVPEWFREGLVLYLSEPPGRARGAGAEAQMRADYAAAYRRVRDLIGRHGREAVMGWLERGSGAGFSPQPGLSPARP